MDGSPKTERFIEIDSARGVLVTLMVAYHTAYSGMFVGVWDLDLGEWSLAWWSARIIAAGFVAVSGMAAAVAAYRRAAVQSDISLVPKRKAAWGFLSIPLRFRHGGLLLGLGMVITVVTWFGVGPQSFVAFGVLHLLGVLKLTDGRLSRMKFVPLILGSCMVASGIWLGPQRFDFPWLFFLGLRPSGYYPIDFFPVLPWAGWYFLGIFAGKVLYPAGKARSFVPLKHEWMYAPAAFLGRHSLAIYVCHIPPILGILYALKLIVSAT